MIFAAGLISTERGRSRSEQNFPVWADLSRASLQNCQAQRVGAVPKSEIGGRRGAELQMPPHCDWAARGHFQGPTHDERARD